MAEQSQSSPIKLLFRTIMENHRSPPMVEDKRYPTDPTDINLLEY